jgi:gliding motility-associated-like protein
MKSLFFNISKMKSPAICNKRALILVILFMGYFTGKACSPLNTPVMTATAMAGGNLLLNMNSVTIYNGCTYNVQVELVCNGAVMTGVAPFYYTSPNMVKNTTPQAYPQMTLSLAGLCQGGVYQYRWREHEACCAIYSAWSAVNSFTMPGVPVPTTLTLNAAPPAICFPQTSQLTAVVSGGCGGGGAGVTYSWIPATGLSCNTCSNPVANPTITTTYTCIVSGSGVGSCWTASNVITVTSFTVAPLLGTVSGPNICAGFSNTISVSSYSGSLQWQSANNNNGPFANVAGATSSILVTPTLSAGNYCYRLIATGCGGSINSNTVCTVVNPSPTVAVSSTSICAGQTASLYANGGTTYTWTAGANPTGVGSATASPPVNTSYTVVGSTNGCTASAVAIVTVFAYPVVNMASNSPVCSGSGINLSATGGGAYVWNGPNGFSSNVQNPVIPTASVANAGVYNVLVTTNNCATAGSVNVIVLNPTVSASNTGPYCSTFTVQLNGASSPALSYTWSGPGYNANSINAIVPNVTVSASGIYTLTINDGTCTASSTTSVTVYPLPVPVALSNAPFCELTDLTFTATGGVTYVWTGPNNFNSVTQNPVIYSAHSIASGNYTLTVTDVNGCIKSITTNVNVKPIPVINTTGAYVCLGATASLSASGGQNYSWTGPNGFVSNNQNIIFPNVNNSYAGSYTVLVTGANSCTNLAGATVTVYPVPVSTSSCSGEVCFNGKAIFQGSGGLLYQWTGPNGFLSNNQNTAINSVNSFDYSGTYTLGVIDDKGCVGYSTTQLLVRALPAGIVSASVNKKCIPFCSTFSITSNNNLQTTQWNLNSGGNVGGTTYSDCFKEAGTYVLVTGFTDVYGCANTTSLEVNAYPIPQADFHFGPGAPVENDQIEFKDASMGPQINNWQWYFVNNTNTSSHQNPTFIFDTPGSYPVTLIVSNKWGCMDTITKPIIIGEDFSLFVPNVFTPNGDGVNDTFQPKGYGIVKYNLQVFDRWGEKLFETNDFTKGWDGTVKTKTGKDEAFIWKIIVNNAQGKIKEYTGHVVLMK